MTRLCVIPAKGSSARIPKKNIRDFLGNPIIAYSIWAARRTELFAPDAIVVSTEDEEVGKIAEQLGAKWWRRPVELCSDSFGPHDVVRRMLSLAASAQHFHELVCILYATAPMVSHRDLLGAEMLVRVTDYDYAISVAADPEPLTDAAHFIWAKADALLAGKPLWTPRTALIPIESARVCDINVESDWSRAEAMYRKAFP